MSALREIAEAVTARERAEQVLCPVSDIAGPRLEIWLDRCLGDGGLFLCVCGEPLQPGDIHRCEP